VEQTDRPAIQSGVEAIGVAIGASFPIHHIMEVIVLSLREVERRTPSAIPLLGQRRLVRTPLIKVTHYGHPIGPERGRELKNNVRMTSDVRMGFVDHEAIVGSR
jgi:hypothetical protein